MVIPHDQLDPVILNALVEEFVTRTGAVHGHTDAAICDMTAAVCDQLRTGAAEILYDEESQTWTIVRKNR